LKEPTNRRHPIFVLTSVNLYVHICIHICICEYDVCLGVGNVHESTPLSASSVRAVDNMYIDIHVYVMDVYVYLYSRLSNLTYIHIFICEYNVYIGIGKIHESTPLSASSVRAVDNRTS